MLALIDLEEFYIVGTIAYICNLEICFVILLPMWPTGNAKLVKILL